MITDGYEDSLPEGYVIAGIYPSTLSVRCVEKKCNDIFEEMLTMRQGTEKSSIFSFTYCCNKKLKRHPNIDNHEILRLLLHDQNQVQLLVKLKWVVTVGER